MSECVRHSSAVESTAGPSRLRPGWFVCPGWDSNPHGVPTEGFEPLITVRPVTCRASNALWSGPSVRAVRPVRSRVLPCRPVLCRNPCSRLVAAVHSGCRRVRRVHDRHLTTPAVASHPVVDVEYELVGRVVFRPFPERDDSTDVLRRPTAEAAAAVESRRVFGDGDRGAGVVVAVGCDPHRETDGASAVECSRVRLESWRARSAVRQKGSLCRLATQRLLPVTVVWRRHQRRRT
jgi:hypothetical protein